MRAKIMIALSVFVLVVLNHDIYTKERIKQRGETLFLELALVDPRSLMQGDYMRLRYAIEDDAPVAEEHTTHQKRGYMLIQTDADNVGQFIGFYEKGNLGQDGKRFRFHRKNGRVRIVPDSFLFQEGHARYYADARYGVFRFDASGKHILVGLADENRRLLEPS